MSSSSEKAPWHLISRNGRQIVKSPDWEFQVDYNQFSFDRITSNPFFKIFKAGHNEKVIVDASAGLGRDSYLIYQLGHSVHSIEENQILFELMQDGKSTLGNTQFWQLHAGNCTDVIPKLEKIDIIYFDPMFEHPKKAKAQKYTQVIQYFCKPEYTNSAETIDFIITYARENHLKLIIKQPQKRSSLTIPKPHHRIPSGRFCEFWVYQF